LTAAGAARLGRQSRRLPGVEALQRRAGVASIIVGAVLMLMVVFYSPAGDLLAACLGEVAAVVLAVAMYAVLRRQRVRSN
jgi:hypothetical protein